MRSIQTLFVVVLLKTAFAAVELLLRRVTPAKVKAVDDWATSA